MSRPTKPNVFDDIHHLAAHLDCLDRASTVNYGRGISYTPKRIVASGGFDPLHLGHLQYIHEAAKLGDEKSKLIVIVNSDEWLIRKKGFSFMPLKERMAIVGAISGVDYVVSWDDGGPTVSGALELLKPNIFAKGGDRDRPENVPEFGVCERINCEVIFGVGGGKIQSSSYLVEKAKESKK